jgi:hypothetical protein
VITEKPLYSICRRWVLKTRRLSLEMMRATKAMFLLYSKNKSSIHVSKCKNDKINKPLFTA